MCSRNRGDFGLLTLLTFSLSLIYSTLFVIDLISHHALSLTTDASNAEQSIYNFWYRIGVFVLGLSWDPEI